MIRVLIPSNISLISYAVLQSISEKNFRCFSREYNVKKAYEFFLQYFHDNRRGFEQLTEAQLRNFQDDITHVVAIVIDEKSMVGSTMLYSIDQRLRQIFPENANVPFGGVSIILVGDFRQLAPVGDAPLYTSPMPDNFEQQAGLAMYQQHFKPNSS